MRYLQIAFASAPVFLAGMVAGLLFGSGASSLAREPDPRGGPEGQGCQPCPADVNNNGSVEVQDLLAVINAWGPCPVGDLDCDGYTVAQGDCDDNNPAIHPGATELCNNVDDDCDGTADEGYNLSTDENNCGKCGNVCAVLPCMISNFCVAGQCVPILQPGWCHIGGQCVVAGTTQPGSPCMMCIPAVSQTSWSPAPAGTACPSGTCDGSGTCIQ